MVSHRFIIPNWNPCLQNVWDGCHWSVRSRLKKADREMIGCYFKQSEIPKATTKRRVTLTIVLGPKQRGGDPDGYWKSLLDSLKHCGAIIDDSRKWVETPPTQFSRDSEHATVIELEDME